MIVCLVLGIFFGKQSPKLELETETETATEDSVPAFGEQTETEDKKTEENKTEGNKVSFTASPANPYFGTELYAAALNTQKMQEGKLQHLPVFKMESREEMNSFYTSFGQSLLHVLRSVPFPWQ